jgi:PDZ domain-containing protein
VESVNDPGPSVGKLQSGDGVVAVDGTKVADIEAFTALMKTTKPGQEIVLDYRRRGGSDGSARITLGKNDDRDYGYLGIAVQDAPFAPFTIDFNLANIGGPSAGLVFSLAAVDKLTTGDINGGKFVAGTGSITPDGAIGPIGGITHKMVTAQKVGATVFLVPADNCDEARTVRGNTMELIKSETLQQTIEALKTLTSGGKPPVC